MDWFNALRAARFHYLQVAFPGASDADVSGSCPCDSKGGCVPSSGMGSWEPIEGHVAPRDPGHQVA